jgi:hypothetical protein
MRALKLIALGVAVTALGLSACGKSDSGREGGNSKICTPFPEVPANTTPAAATAQAAADPAGAVDDCLHRWGYSLAPSADRAQEVAQAAVAACSTLVTRWNQQGLTANAQTGAGPGVSMAPSLVTGQPTNPIAEHYAYAQNRALFYVVQARAGKCPPPHAASQK